jgi:gamma-glutamyltranspeptidase/glutathione hydrolase
MLVAVGVTEAAGVSGAPAGASMTLPPELATPEVRSSAGMVASADPVASSAGARILDQGGNAVDAAVATALALGVVDPTCGGLGGQVLMLVRLRDGRLVVIDGSAPVPLGASAREIQALKDADRLFGYRISATPTTLAALAHALERYGTMTLAQVLQPAIEIAEGGHLLRPYVLADLGAEAHKVRENEYLAGLFLRDGLEVWPEGCLIRQPALAATMRRLAADGAADFYHGRLAAEIDADMRANGGYVRGTDLAAVKVTEMPPVRGRYRGFEVVSVPSPGGGEILLGALQILGAFPDTLLRSDSVDRLHLLVEAVRIAMIDVRSSASTVRLDADYGRRRSALVRFDRALRNAEILSQRPRWNEARGTTHVSVVDRWGAAVAMTQTLGVSAFVATPTLGFQYNSFLGTFDTTHKQSPAYLAPGRVAPTSMAPTMLLKDGVPVLILGSAGSSRMPSSLVAVISNIVDRGLPLGEAVAAPRVVVDPPSDTRVLLELAGAITTEQADILAARGFGNQFRLTFPPRPVDICAFGGVNAVQVGPDGVLVGVGDPRRQSGAAGAGVVAGGLSP